MAITFLAPALLTGAAAAAILFAPTAAAAGSADCEDYGPSSVCTRNGHAAIIAEPQQSGSGGLSIIPGGGTFGAGGNLPLMVID